MGPFFLECKKKPPPPALPNDMCQDKKPSRPSFYVWLLLLAAEVFYWKQFINQRRFMKIPNDILVCWNGKGKEKKRKRNGSVRKEIERE